MLVLHSLPLEFPLAMAFAEQLLTYTMGETIDCSEDELDAVPTSVLMQVVELLGKKCSFISPPEDQMKQTSKTSRVVTFFSITLALSVFRWASVDHRSCSVHQGADLPLACRASPQDPRL